MRTFISPVDREDIHKLTVVEGSAARMAMYRIGKPTPAALRLAEIIILSCDQVVRGVSVLPRLDLIQEHCIEFNCLENEADEVSREAIAALFVEEAHPLEVIKWKEIYETMETATDRCEDVVNILEEIV